MKILFISVAVLLLTASAGGELLKLRSGQEEESSSILRPLKRRREMKRHRILYAVTDFSNMYTRAMYEYTGRHGFGVSVEVDNNNTGIYIKYEPLFTPVINPFIKLFPSFSSGSIDISFRAGVNLTLVRRFVIRACVVSRYNSDNGGLDDINLSAGLGLNF